MRSKINFLRNTSFLFAGIVTMIFIVLVFFFNNFQNQHDSLLKNELNALGSPEQQRELCMFNQSQDSSTTAEMNIQMWNEIQKIPSEEDLFNTENTEPWTCLGPFGMYFPDNNITYAGRIKNIEPPKGSKPLRVAAASGGLWEYQNMVPVPISENLSSQLTTTFVTDPMNDDHIIVGTGEFGYRGSGTGIWYTFDRGETWNQASVNPVPNQVLHIEYSPGSTSVLHAATNEGYFQSNDNGMTWTHKAYGTVTDVSVNSVNPDIIYIGTYWQGVYKSTDGGNTFSLLSGTGLPSQ